MKVFRKSTNKKLKKEKMDRESINKDVPGVPDLQMSQLESLIFLSLFFHAVLKHHLTLGEALHNMTDINI